MVSYGPAVLFTSDDVNTSSSGSIGASGSVTSSTDILNINKSTTQPTITGGEILTANEITSTCTATTATPTGSTTITTGKLRTDSGLDLNGDGDYLDAGEHAPVDATLSSSPTANTTYYGHIHLSSTATDNFKVVLNEQSTSSGTLTVSAVHEYFGVTSSGNDPNSALHGDLVIGRVVCGLTF